VSRLTHGVDIHTRLKHMHASVASIHRSIVWVHLGEASNLDHSRKYPFASECGGER